MIKRPRILAICQEDPEYILGGMGRHLQELYKAIAERGDVEVDLLVNGPASESYLYNGHKKHHGEKLLCYKPKAPNMASLLVSDIQLATTLTRLIAEGYRWDLVHVHEWNAVQVARIARAALGIPMVGTMHLCITALMEDAGANVEDFAETDIYLMQQEGHLIVDVDELILCSRAYERLARRIFMTDRPINVIYNGIDGNAWRPSWTLAERARVELSLPADRPIALFVGRIADMKGVRELLDAVENWDDCPYTLVLSGEVNANTAADRERWDVTRRIRALEEAHPERLRWVGFQGDELLRGLYSLAEIGVMPSIHEPFGIVALEFMAAGVPLICTEIDGLGEIATDDDRQEYALIVDPNPEQIRRAMDHLRKHPEARRELSCQGRVRAGHFTWQEAAAQTVGLYKKLIENRRGEHDSAIRADSSQKSNAA
jgi:glycosyltransferase involved in cell wall biosynthesis